MVRIKASRREDLKAEIEDILKRRTLSPGQAAKLKGQFQPPSRPLLALRNVALKTRRKLASRDESSGSGGAPCGVLYLSILGGRYTTRRAYWICELDGNERRTSTATCDSPAWEGEEFVLPVHDPSSDLRLLLFVTRPGLERWSAAACLSPS